MFYSKLQHKLSERSCGSCTMCCSGHFGLICNGEVIQSKGKPCKYLSEHDSCVIYSNRPECCKIFMCLYRQDTSVPEWLKPNNSQVIMAERYIDNIKYLEVFECGAGLPDNLVEWIYMRHIEKKQNVIISYNNLFYLLVSNTDPYDATVEFYSKLYNKKIYDASTLPEFFKYFDLDHN